MKKMFAVEELNRLGVGGWGVEDSVKLREGAGFGVGKHGGSRRLSCQVPSKDCGLWSSVEGPMVGCVDTVTPRGHV